MVNYYLLGAHWGNNDQTKRFLEGGIWENGYDDKYSEIVNSINKSYKVFIC